LYYLAAYNCLAAHQRRLPRRNVGGSRVAPSKVGRLRHHALSNSTVKMLLNLRDRLRRSEPGASSHCGVTYTQPEPSKATRYLPKHLPLHLPCLSLIGTVARAQCYCCLHAHRRRTSLGAFGGLDIQILFFHFLLSLPHHHHPYVSSTTRSAHTEQLHEMLML
jgi:hypothetical protein